MSSHSRHVPGLHADAGLMHADAGPTRAEESTLPAVELFPSGERSSDAHTPHTHAPAVFPQLSSARTPFTLPHTSMHTTAPRSARPSLFPILGAHMQSALPMAAGQQRAAAAMEQAAAHEQEVLMRDECTHAQPHLHAAPSHPSAHSHPAVQPGPEVQPSPQANTTPPPMRAPVSAPPTSDPRHLHPIHINNINNQGLEQRMERKLRDVSSRLEAVNEETQSLRAIVHDVLAKLSSFTDVTHRKEDAVRAELEHFKAYITTKVREMRSEQDRLGNFAAALTASSLTPPGTLEAALTQHREQLLDEFTQQLRQELSAFATHLCTDQVPDPVVEAEAAEAAEAERLERENEEYRRELAERERVHTQPQPELQFIKHAPPPPPPPPIALPYATHIPPLFPPTIISPPPPTQQPAPAVLAPWLPPPPAPMPTPNNPGSQAPKMVPPTRDPRLVQHPGAGRGGGRTGGGRGTGYTHPPYKKLRPERTPGSRADLSASLAALSAQNKELREQIAQKN